VISIFDPFAYDSTVHTVLVRDVKIKIDHLVPLLTEKDRMERQRCIEEALFGIFYKYSNDPSI